MFMACLNKQYPYDLICSERIKLFSVKNKYSFYLNNSKNALYLASFGVFLKISVHRIINWKTNQYNF